MVGDIQNVDEAEKELEVNNNLSVYFLKKW